MSGWSVLALSWPLLFAVVSLACDDGRESSGIAPEIADQVACHEDPSVATMALDTVVLADTAPLVATVTAADVTEEGGLWLVDASGPVAVRIGPSGTLEAAITATGEGPGELAEPRAAATGPDGGLLLVDADPPRLMRFDSSGAFVDSRRLEGASRATDLAVTRNSTVYVALIGISPSVRSPDRLAHGRFFVVRVGERGITGLDALDGRFGEAPFWSAPTIAPHLASSPGGGVVVTYEEVYRLRRFSADGELSSTRRGCEGTIGNEQSLKEGVGATEGGRGDEGFFFRPLVHELSYAGDTLYHLTPTADHGYHLLDRWVPTEKGWERSRPILVPGRERGGAYLGALLPAPGREWMWGYNHIEGRLYQVRLEK